MAFVIDHSGRLFTGKKCSLRDIAQNQDATWRHISNLGAVVCDLAFEDHLICLGRICHYERCNGSCPECTLHCCSNMPPLQKQKPISKGHYTGIGMHTIVGFADGRGGQAPCGLFELGRFLLYPSTHILVVRLDCSS